MKLVLLKTRPPVGPSSAPITWSKRQAIEPVFGQAGSEPALAKCLVCAHTLLLSKELCQVALAKASVLGANLFGFVLGLRKWVMIWTCCPKKVTVIGTYRPVDVILADHPLKGVKRELQAHGLCHELPLEYLAEEAVA